jgi:hypothetical protein
MKPGHMLVCAALLGIGVVLVLTGAGAVAVLAPLGCVAMMGAMAWMMIRSGGHGRGD